MSRERVYVAIVSKGMEFPIAPAFIADVHSRLRYVDRLTKKQQAAIAMLNMAEIHQYIKGVGGKYMVVKKIEDAYVLIPAYVLHC